MKVLFVCLGNICRSPLAEAIFAHRAEKRGLEAEWDSAGTGHWHAGESPDRRMQAVASANGIPMDSVARQVRPTDFEEFDLVVAMDTENLWTLRSRSDTGHHGKIRLMREWDPEAAPTDVVPDPWYGGPEGFNEVFRIVDRSVQGLVEAIERGDIPAS